MPRLPILAATVGTDSSWPPSRWRKPRLLSLPGENRRRKESKPDAQQSWGYPSSYERGHVRELRNLNGVTTDVRALLRICEGGARWPTATSFPHAPRGSRHRRNGPSERNHIAYLRFPASMIEQSPREMADRSHPHRLNTGILSRVLLGVVTISLNLIGGITSNRDQRRTWWPQAKGVKSLNAS